MAVLLGVLIAAAFGTGDYVGGRASTSSASMAVLVVAQLCSVIGALGLAMVVTGDLLGTDVAHGAAAGAVNVIGLALLYDGLARYKAAVVAPVTAVVASTVPVAWGLLNGERPPGQVLAGVVLAVAAAGLVATEPRGEAAEGQGRALVQAAASGICLGSSLVLFAATSERSGQWPVLAARLAALVTAGLAVLLLRRREEVRVPAGNARAMAAGAGVLDVAATALLVVAVRQELVVVVAPLASLAPAFTVAWSWGLERQRLRRTQAVGVVLALAALALIATG